LFIENICGEKMQVLDQYDFKILTKLMDNGRASFSEIARELNVTDVAIKKRFENLISKGIIKKISVELDYKVLGIDGELFVLLKVPLLSLDKNAATLQENDFVKFAYKTIGDYNLFFSYLLKDLNQFDTLDKLLSKLTDLEEFKILIVNKKLFEKNTIPKSSLQIYYR
jgi:Lrp/AsnC family transcriptional regulator for asnA, asnC and gidA